LKRVGLQIEEGRIWGAGGPDDRLSAAGEKGLWLSRLVRFGLQYNCTVLYNECTIVPAYQMSTQYSCTVVQPAVYIVQLHPSDW